MKLLLTTLHAKYSHASLALPCLAAACLEMPGVEIAIAEWTVNEPAEQLLRQIMSHQARVVAFSCYIWNIESCLKLASDIKKIAANTIIVLGGPEASFGIFELMHANPSVDFVVKGEGETVFRRLIEALSRFITGPEPRPLPEGQGIFSLIDNLFFRDDNDISSGPLNTTHLTLDSIPSPFQAGLVDLSRPLIYYETSRGCPFSCAFCLSSMEGRVRSFSPQRIEEDLGWLMRRNLSQIKLVDRTFNYDAGRANRIWKFILENNRSSHFHFEIAADLLTEENLLLLRSVPPDSFCFEIGVQSASSRTLELVERKSDLERIYANVRRLREETSVELHLDLLAGLPGEEYEGVLESLQQVAGLRPHVIQIEPLKVLKGSPMRKIARKADYRFSDSPPYTILTTPWLSFDEIGRIETIARLLDLFYNQGGFETALAFMLQQMDFAALFDRLARQSGTENLSGRSTRRSYELFANLAGALLSETGRRFLHDALFFDYCLKELPLQGKLPDFIADRQQQCSWPGRRELALEPDQQAGCRIRAFRFDFENDHRSKSMASQPTTITFVYLSSAGRGLRVLVR
jgi:anaerobic magnesium-protoporphyrin IX monomethyl ester cyclase